MAVISKKWNTIIKRCFIVAKNLTQAFQALEVCESAQTVGLSVRVVENTSKYL